MSESLLATVLLGVIGLCLIIVTGAIVSTAHELRETLRYLNALLPEARRAFHDAHRSLQQVQGFLTRANRATRHLERVIQQLCGAASDTVDRWTHLTDTAKGWWSQRFGNGARAEPRQHHRGHRS